MFTRLMRAFGRCLSRDRERGVGLIEVMLAVLVFATAMTGVLAFQVQAMRASSAALQRSTAVLLAQDILARIRANPGEVDRYTGNGFGDARSKQPDPARDCERVPCNQADLAVFDRWHWESLLLDASALAGGPARGGLHLPRACISHQGGWVTLQLFWRGAGSRTGSSEDACRLPDENLYDDPSGPPGNNRLRSMLVVSELVRGSAG